MSHAESIPSDSSASSIYFDKERDRLLNEVASSLETILSNSNTLNRQLEASIAVGREFEPIAQLWGRFSSVMQAAGIPEYTGVGLHQVGPGSSSTNPSAGAEQTGLGVVHELDGEAGSGVGHMAGANDEGGLRRSRGIEPGLPPGVAPGGGVIYGRS